MYMQTSTYQQVNHYYPYGGVMGESTGGDIQKYKYNGKRLERNHGLDWYDYGARHYDAATANALKTGNRKAITFNPAALTKATINALNISVEGKQRNITNYIVEGEIVDYSQSKFGLKPIGNVYSLKASYLPELTSTTSLINMFKRIYNHCIDTLIDKLK